MVITDKDFVALDACGGTVAIKAIYDFTTDEPASYESIRIDKSIHDGGNDTEINNALISAIS